MLLLRGSVIGKLLSSLLFLAIFFAAGRAYIPFGSGFWPLGFTARYLLMVTVQ